MISEVDHFPAIVKMLERCDEQSGGCEGCQRLTVCKKWFDFHGTSIWVNRNLTFHMPKHVYEKAVQSFNVMVKHDH